MSVSALLLFAIHTIAFSQASPSSQWAKRGASGKLIYQMLQSGDRIADFSCAGYGRGGTLPSFPVRKKVVPSGLDDTAAIQAAIDETASLPLIHGVRGAVMLERGRFHCSSTLRLNADGVVLGRSGSGESDTVIEMTGEPHRAIAVDAKSAVI
jgi:hypothetical protein